MATLGNVSSPSQPLSFSFLLIPYTLPHTFTLANFLCLSPSPIAFQYAASIPSILPSPLPLPPLSTIHSIFPSGSSHTLTCTWNSTGCSGMTISICQPEREEFVPSLDRRNRGERSKPLLFTRYLIFFLILLFISSKFTLSSFLF